jgi:hypothetical protein
MLDRDNYEADRLCTESSVYILVIGEACVNILVRFLSHEIRRETVGL